MRLHKWLVLLVALFVPGWDLNPSDGLRDFWKKTSYAATDLASVPAAGVAAAVSGTQGLRSNRPLQR